MTAADGTLVKPGPFERVGDRLAASELAQTEETRRRFAELDAYLQTLPPGREQALARTHLELAGTMATKATTHVPRPPAV